jgi:hypothetical protein
VLACRFVIPEAPFLFSIAGLSASLAGLAGLVAGLRRGTDLRPLDAFRLRQIVEFCFANIVFAVALVPLVLILNANSAVRLESAATAVYVISNVILLGVRSRNAGITWTRGWAIGATILSSAAIVSSIIGVATGSFPIYEITLVVLLARPMFAFLLVLASFGQE